jgi:hypothetical protein
VVVERAFMRNTFNLAFSNHSGVKRRYMFSVDDPLIRHQWTVSLKRQIDKSSSSTTGSSASLGTSKFHRAAERTAFMVLQETLIGPECSSGPPLSPVGKTLDPLPVSPRTPYGPKDQRRGPQVTVNNGVRNSHVRSKSRSQVYHKHGAGRLELDLNQSGYSSFDSLDGEDNGRSASTNGQGSRIEGRVWSSRGLEMHCQQNSSIALVLSYLQIGAPDHDQSYS